MNRAEKDLTKLRRHKLLHAFRENGETATRDRLVAECAPLVSGIARGFANQGEQQDDLIQVGSIGLLKAIDHFDPDRGVEFTTYAVSMIVGEIRHHLRDKARLVRIPRGLWDLHVRLYRQKEELTRTLGRVPTTREIGSAAGVAEGDVAEALRVRSASQPGSLSVAVGLEDGKEVALVELIGDDDPGYGAAENRLTLATGLRLLAPRERRVLHMRYHRNLTQARIASELGVSQIHVSRIIRKALDTLGQFVEAA